MIGCLLNADIVFSFSPQTYFSKRMDKKYGVSKAAEILKKEYPDFTINERETDLKTIMTTYGKNNKTLYKIFYGSLNYGDREYVIRLSYLKNVEVFTTESVDHNIVKVFLGNGMLKEMIEKFIKGELQ